MRKRVLSDKELNQLIKLKQANASWLRVEKETGIPRRAARRAYEEWEAAQSFADLHKVRMNVADAIFREHMESLVQIAVSLAIHLDIPRSPNELIESSVFLDGILINNIRENPHTYGRFKIADQREQQFALKQQYRLLKSLQEHTRNEMKWELFEEWKNSWDECISVYSLSRDEARVMMENFISQDAVMWSNIRAATKEKDPMRCLIGMVLNQLWQVILEDKPKDELSMIKVKEFGGETNPIIHIMFDDEMVLEMNDKAVGGKVVEICNQTVKNLYIAKQAEIIQPLRRLVGCMRRAIDSLSETLDPIVLKPIIIRTRCSLCPA